MKINRRQEKFCQFYVKNSELFGNGTQCYAKVYNFDLNNKETYEKNINICKVNASKLLTKSNIQDRLTVLFNEMLTNELVDRELSKLMLQDEDRNVKLGALKEYNKLKQRITEHTDLNIILPQPIYGGLKVEDKKDEQLTISKPVDIIN